MTHPLPLAPSLFHNHHHSKYLAAMQKVREAYVNEYRAKQEHLLNALSEEAALWITEENIDEVGERRFLVPYLSNRSVGRLSQRSIHP